MAVVEPVAEPAIEEILITMDPLLDYFPDWLPAPDPIVKIPFLTTGFRWENVADWAKAGYETIFRGGTRITTVTPEMVQNAADAAVGQTVKAMSGFINQSVGMTLNLAKLMDATIGNMESNALNDFRVQSQRLDQIDAVQDYMAQYVVPALNAKIDHSTATAYAFAVAAQDNAIRDARETIFKPLYTELLKVQPAIDQSIKTNNPTILDAAQSKVNALHDLLIPTLTGLAAGLGKVETEVEECVKPMCESLGPKSKLGKLLKALNIAADAALIAELLTMDEGELVSFMRTVAGKFGALVNDFEDFFGSGGETLGGLVRKAIPDVL